MMSSARMQPMANMSTGAPYLLARSSTSGARYLHPQSAIMVMVCTDHTFVRLNAAA